MLRRSVLLLPAVLAALALPVAPALAGEDDGSTPPPPPPAPAPGPVPSPAPNSAKLTTRGCAPATRVKARATVTGSNIEKVAFYVDGKRIKTVFTPAANGSYSFSMSCSRLSVGAHRARAAVTFQAGTSPATQTLRFQITRTQQASARFTG